MDAADNRCVRCLQCRLHRQAGFTIEDDLVVACCLQIFEPARGHLEHLLLSEDVENTVAAMIVGNASVGANLLYCIPAKRRDAKTRECIPPVTRPGAISQKLESPRPHLRIGLKPKHDRCIFFGKGLEDLHGKIGACPGYGMTGRNLVAIGIAGLKPGSGLTIDNSDLMAGTIEKIGTGNANNAGPENDDFHGISPEVGSRQPRRSDIASQPTEQPSRPIACPPRSSDNKVQGRGDR